MCTLSWCALYQCTLYIWLYKTLRVEATHHSASSSASCPSPSGRRSADDSVLARAERSSRQTGHLRPEPCMRSHWVRQPAQRTREDSEKRQGWALARDVVVRTIAEDVPARRLHLFLRRLEAARTRELLLHLLIYRPRVAFRGARLPADHAERVVLVQCLRQGNPPWVRAHGRAALSSVADSPGRWCATPPRPTCAETPP